MTKIIPVLLCAVLLIGCASSEDTVMSTADTEKSAIAAAPKASQETEPAQESLPASAPQEAEEDIALGESVPSMAKKEAMADLGGAGDTIEEEPAPVQEQSRPAEPTVRFLSADDSNSAASPVIARKAILAGKYVQPALIRTYEFLNYYSFSYPPPEQEWVGIDAQMRPLKDGEYSLQVAVRSINRTLAELKPLNIIFVLDTSGSMAGEPIELAIEMIRSFVARMRTGDRYSLITCNREARILLESVDVPDSNKLEQALSNLEVNDITDLQKGVLLAYQLADTSYDYRRLSRVVLLSDGADNSGEQAVQVISKHAQESDRQGIYLAGIGFGEGFNDQLMDTFTDKGRGAYLFVDSRDEIQRILKHFVANFDLAVKNVRLKMVMPPGWTMTEFHGEQVSARASDIVPQYLSPNDQMIYHLTVSTEKEARTAALDEFAFEVEYAPLSAAGRTLGIQARVSDMLSGREILKGDAVVVYAELLKEIQLPLDKHRGENLTLFDGEVAKIEHINEQLRDDELSTILTLLESYRQTVASGERFPGSRDRSSDEPGAVLGIDPRQVRRVRVVGDSKDRAVKALPRLGNSTRLVPQEGYRFLAMSSGPVWNPAPAGSGELSSRWIRDPAPEYMGLLKSGRSSGSVVDLHQIVLELTAPAGAESFSFDFNFFSAEYPEYVNQNFNDTFYAILEAPSTNRGRSTNIAFDAGNNSIEVDNNYFQRPFHPIPNTGTGFDAHGSTGWLRTGWPIRGGEKFTLTFSIHDEGDGIYDSLVVLDNFRFHDYPAVGTTDPLN